MNNLDSDIRLAKDKWNNTLMTFLAQNGKESQTDIEFLKISLVQQFTKEIRKSISTLTLVKIKEYIQTDESADNFTTLINYAFIERFSASESKVKFFYNSLSEKEKTNLFQFLIENQEYELLLLLPKNKKQQYNG